MFDVYFSKAALNNLDEIWAYIAFELSNSDAAENTVNGILDAIRIREFSAKAATEK